MSGCLVCLRGYQFEMSGCLDFASKRVYKRRNVHRPRCSLGDYLASMPHLDHPFSLAPTTLPKGFATHIQAKVLRMETSAENLQEGNMLGDSHWVHVYKWRWFPFGLSIIRNILSRSELYLGLVVPIGSNSLVCLPSIASGAALSGTQMQLPAHPTI